MAPGGRSLLTAQGGPAPAHVRRPQQRPGSLHSPAGLRPSPWARAQPEQCLSFATQNSHCLTFPCHCSGQRRATCSELALLTPSWPPWSWSRLIMQQVGPCGTRDPVPRWCEGVAEVLWGRQLQESRDKGGTGAHAATGEAVPGEHRQADRGQHQPQGRDKALASRVQNQDLVQGLV